MLQGGENVKINGLEGGGDPPATSLIQTAEAGVDAAKKGIAAAKEGLQTLTQSSSLENTKAKLQSFKSMLNPPTAPVSKPGALAENVSSMLPSTSGASESVDIAPKVTTSVPALPNAERVKMAQEAAAKAVIPALVKNEVKRQLKEDAGVSALPSNELTSVLIKSNNDFQKLENEIKKTKNRNLLEVFKQARNSKIISENRLKEEIGTLKAIEARQSSDPSFVAGLFHEANVGDLFRKVNYEPVNIESYLFHIRIPDESGYVQKDWEEGRYTKDEASFLNLLQITPKMLLELFGGNWRTSLANFIRGISTTSCYKDMNLITKGECQNVRYFLEKIHYWFKRHPSARLVKSSV
jgi:hypothetical protein